MGDESPSPLSSATEDVIAEVLGSDTDLDLTVFEFTEGSEGDMNSE